MATPTELIQSLDAILDDEILDSMVANFDKMMGPVLAEIELLLKELSVDSAGNVKPTTGNMKIINRAKTKLINAIGGDDYQAAINAVESGFSNAVETMNAYMTVLTGSFDEGAKLRALVEVSISSLTDQISSTRLGQVFAEQVGTIMNNAITRGLPFRALMNAVQEQLKAEALMNVTRFNIKQTVTDAFGVMNRSYLNLAAERAGLHWYRYQGGVIKTTRSFCEERNGKYYHEKEIKSWGDQNWDGKMEGTTPQTILKTAGGYNCRHIFAPVMEQIVPESAKQRYLALNL